MLEKIINNKLVINHVKKAVNNPACAAKFLIGASVAKDAFEYTISAVQSLKNKELPKEKRKLVATMDATTGIISCVSQLAIGFGLANDKIQKAMGDFLFKDLIKAGELKTVQKCRAGLAIASSLVLSTVIVKRIIAPLLATPIANYGSNFLSKRQERDKLEKV